MLAEVGKTVLESIPNVDVVEYDFENYALTQGIPETLDPLPYRKSGSVFATGDEAEPQLTSAKHDPRLRTVVCRHWLRDLCMKGAACEFLHQYDLSKMPDKAVRALFITLGETWWWESNRILPIDVFLHHEMKPFQKYLTTMVMKDVDHMFGPMTTLQNMLKKRIKRRGIQLQNIKRLD